MANNIKGITIELGGNTGPLTSALKDVNKSAGDAQNELKEVNKQLKFDPSNVVLSGQKLDLLKQKAEALGEKEKILKKAVQDAHAAFEKGDMGADKVRAVEREYEKVNSQLKETKKDLAAAEVESGSFTEKVKGKFSQLKGKIKDTFSSENIKTAVGAAGVAVGGFLKSSVDEAGEAEKANADLAQTLKSTKDASGMTMQSLNDLTQAMVENTTFSDDEVKSGEGMLLTFTNIGKNVFPQATAALLDMSQKMGTDTKTQAIQLGKALNDPVKGVTALTKVGVTFTDQQKKQIAAMEKTGNTAGAQKVILAELNKEFGGQAATAADTYAGKQKQVGNELKEVKETIGTALMPILANLLKSVTPIIQSVANFVTKNPQLVAGILAVIAVVGTMVGGMQLLTTVTTFFGLAADASLAPILPVVLAVTAAVVGLSVLAAVVVKNWGSVSGFFVNLWNTIKGLFAGIGQWFSSVFSAAASGIQAAWSGIKSFFSEIWSGIQGVFSAVGSWFSSIFGAAWSGIKSAWSAVSGFFSGIWNGIKNIFNNVKDWFGDRFKDAQNAIKTHFSPDALSSHMSSAWKGMQNAFSNIRGWFGDRFRDAQNAIKEHFSPTMLSDHFNSVWKSVQNTFSKLNPIEWGKDLINGFINGIKSGFKAVQDAVGWVAGKIKSVLHFSRPDEGPLVDYETWMPDMMAGLAHGIVSNIGLVKGAARQTAAALSTSLDSTYQVHTAMAAANGVAPTAKNATAEQTKASTSGTSTSAGQPVNLTVVTADGRTLGRFMAPYVGKELEFKANDLFPARG